MPAEEGDALYEACRAGRDVARLPFLEVGRTAAARPCGSARSARHRRRGVRRRPSRGSEENQPGWEWHDSTLVDPAVAKMDTLPPSAARSTMRGWRTRWWPSSVDPRSSPRTGARRSRSASSTGVTASNRRADYEGWTPHVAGRLPGDSRRLPGSERGWAPSYEQIFLPALESGRFRLVSATGSCGAPARRLSHTAVD